MIKSFKHKGLKKLFETGQSSAVNPQHVERLRKILALLETEAELVMVLEDPRGRFLKRPTNICFGWENLETAFIGSLDGTGILNFRAPYPGVKLIHQQPV